MILCSTDIWDEGLGVLLACKRSKLRPEQHFNPSLMQKVVLFFPRDRACSWVLHPVNHHFLNALRTREDRYFHICYHPGAQ